MTRRTKFEIMAPHLPDGRLSQTMLYLTLICLAQSGTGAKLDHQSDLYKTAKSNSRDFSLALFATPLESKLDRQHGWKSLQKEVLKTRFDISQDNFKDYSIDKRVPKYLLHLYSKFREEWKNISLTVGGRMQNLGEVNTIRQHLHHETELIQSTSHQIMHFNLSKLDHEDEDILTELRFFYDPLSHKIDLGHKLFDFHLPPNDSSIQFFDVSHLNATQQQHPFLNRSVNFHYPLAEDQLHTNHSTNSLSIHLRNALQNVRGKNGSQKRLSILIKQENLRPNILRRKKRHSNVLEADRSPILLTYHRRKRSPSSTTEYDIMNESNSQNNLKQSNRMRHRGRFHTIRRMCQVKKLYVSFKKINWHKFIMLPEGYYANMCQGECEFPMSDNYNPTAHAIIQYLMHSLKPKRVPPPCCVPTRMKSESILQIERNGNYALRVYDDMVVEQCGCR